MANTHKHECPTCKHVWEHSDDCAGNAPSHTCEKCGDESWGKYYGDKEAAPHSVSCVAPPEFIGGGDQVLGLMIDMLMFEALLELRDLDRRL